MATYGYSTPYTGMRQPVLPPGYMEAATAPGRNLAAGIAQLGAGIGQAIQRYQDNKAQNEAAIQTGETLFGMAQQALASDPSYQALQNYYETGQLPPGVSEADLNRFTQKVQADRSMLNRMVAIGDKFGDMSLAKKKAAIGDVAMLLNQYQQRGEQETTRALREAQLAQAQIAVGQAKAEELGQKQLSDALRAAYGVQAGQAPAVPFRSVTSELLSRYGNLTPAQQAQVAAIAEQRAATPPAGLVPMEATVRTPAGGTVTYGKPVDLTTEYKPIPGTTKIQAYQGGKAVGAPIEKQPEIASEIDKLPEEKQKWANDTFAKLRDNKAFVDFNTRTDALAQVQSLAGSKNPSPADDIALIIRFNKVMDPAGAVLEGEFKRSVESGSVPERVRQYYDYATAGNQLTEKMRKDIVNSAQAVVTGSLRNVSDLIDNEVKAAKYRGVPIEAVIPNSMLNVWKGRSEAQPDVGQPLTSSQGVPRFMSIEEANSALGPGKTAMVRNPKTGQMQQYTTE